MNMTYNAANVEDEERLVSKIAARIRNNRSHLVPRSTAGPYSVDIPETTVSYGLVPIPEGEFWMGSPESDLYARPDEQPRHRVRIQAFWMQEHAVTWDEFQLFMFAGAEADPEDMVDAVTRPTRPYVDMSFGMGIGGYPAISMTQHAANKYAQWLSAKTGEFYRLPTEAEWEYACRAGTATTFFFGSDILLLPEYAWFAENSGGHYEKVATRKPNPWGLYDMLGNVMEWTLDQYVSYEGEPADSPYASPAQQYPIAVRGGCWASPAQDTRCAARVPSDPAWKRQDPQLPKSIWYHTDAPWVGFRLVSPAAVPSEEDMFRYWNNGVEYDLE